MRTRSVLLCVDDDVGEENPHLPQPVLHFKLSTTHDASVFLLSTATTSISYGTIFHASCGSAGDSLASTARRGRIPCSREAQRGEQAGDGAVATCLQKETRWEAKSGRPDSRALCEWIASLEAPPEDFPPAKRPVWWRHGMSLFDERSGWSCTGACETEASNHQPSRELRNWVVEQRTAAPLARMGQQDGHGPPDGMACVPALAVDADAATMAG